MNSANQPTKSRRFNAGGCLLVLILMGVAGWGISSISYQLSYWFDRRDRPWAYADQPATPVLVGTWQGTFRDPDGIPKTLRLTITEPVTDEERAEKLTRWLFARRSRRYHTENKQSFHGVATVKSRLGTEAYEIDGRVTDKTGHRLKSLRFSTPDGGIQLRKNFGLRTTTGEGIWQDNELTLTLDFVYITATGSSFSTSADPRYRKEIRVNLHRQGS